MYWNQGKWMARIESNGKRIFLGDYHFETEEAFQYNDKALELFGLSAKLNVIDLDDIK